MHSKNPIQAYKDWILVDRSFDEELEVYVDDAIFQEREPIVTESYNAGKEHIKRFDSWIKEVEAQGYTIEAEAW